MTYTNAICTSKMNAIVGSFYWENHKKTTQKYYKYFLQLHG